MDTSETRRRRGQPIRGLLLIGFRRNERVRAATVAQREQKAHRQCLGRRVHSDRSHGNHNPYRSACLVLHVFQCIPGKLLASLDASAIRALYRTGEGCRRIGAHAFHGRGLLHPVETVPIDSPQAFTEVSVEMGMDGLLDGGFFWFDAKATDTSALYIADACWEVPTAQRPNDLHPFSIAITTFNRPSYCLRQLRAIAANADVRARLDTIYCTDQGTDHVCDQPDFDETADELGTQLTYIQQANLGGSGGFSRGMYETLKAGTSAHTLLLDDDAISEPESIIRAVQFADYYNTPTIVGGGMLHLDNRTVMYAQGERVDMREMRMFRIQP